ncbi:MAG: T9SS type A sorting domain-containing protein [Flavobacteriales bacterium]
MMKSLFLSFALSLCVLSFAQDGIVIHVDGQTTDLSGSTYNVLAPSGSSFDIPLDVENHTGGAHAWRVTRLRIDAPAGWTDALCWGHATDPFGGTCYSSSQMNTNPWTTPGAQAVLFTINDGEYGKLKASVDPADGVYGTAHYRYYISTNGTLYNDSIDVVVDYAAAIKQIKEEIGVSVYPNPSTDVVTVQLSGMDQSTLKLMDAVGNVIMKETVHGSKKINVAEFSNGIYFLIFETAGGKTITKKLVVRH